MEILTQRGAQVLTELHLSAWLTYSLLPTSLMHLHIDHPLELAALAHIATHMPQLRVLSFKSSSLDSRCLLSFLLSASQGAALSVHVWPGFIGEEGLTEQQCLQIDAEVSLFRGAHSPSLVWHSDRDYGDRISAYKLRVQ
jgi:hypothetical protein